MKLRAALAITFWLLIVALLVVMAVLGFRNGIANGFDAVSLLALLAFGTVGPLIVLRRPENAIGWIFCLDVLLNAAASVAHEVVQFTQVTQPMPLPAANWLAWIVSWVGDSGWSLLFTFTFLLFPNGRLPSRRWRPLAWLTAGIVIFHSLVAMFRPGPFEGWPELSNPAGVPIAPLFLQVDAGLGNWVVLMVFVCVASLVWRFRAVQGEERQQIKWVAYVAALLLLVISIQAVVGAGDATPVGVILDGLVTLTFTAFPIAVGLSILRYRLWDIDVLIRRTLIYGALTAALALVYTASTVVLQSVLRAFTRTDSQLVIVLSTLIIAALSAPLRRRLQAAIDRRFYRRKVDAAQTVAAFGATARDEVDLDTLTQALLDSVGSSFQPEHLTLWLPQATPRPKP